MTISQVAGISQPFPLIHKYCFAPRRHIGREEAEQYSCPSNTIFEYARQAILSEFPNTSVIPLRYDHKSRLKMISLWINFTNIQSGVYVENKDIVLANRKRMLIEQVKFAAKYRVLTFRYLLFAYEGTNLKVDKFRTWIQDTSVQTESNRAKLRRSHEGAKKVKDFVESHISCCPALVDNLYIRDNISYFVERYSRYLHDPTNIQELETAMNDDGFTANSQNALLMCLNYYNETPNFALDFLYRSFFIKNPQNSFRTLIFIKKNIKKLGDSHPINKSVQEYFVAFDKINNQVMANRALIGKIRKEIRNKKVKNSVSADEECQKIDKEIQELKTACQTILKGVIHTIVNQSNGLETNEKTTEILTLVSNTQQEMLSLHLKIFYIWKKSMGSSDNERLRLILQELYTEKSLVRPGGLLFELLNKTITLPSELEKLVFSKLDSLHFEVPKLITEFSQIESPDIDKWLQVHIDGVKRILNTLNRRRKTNQITLDEAINDDTISVGDLCLKHIHLIIDVFNKNTTYKRKFEENTFGEILKDPKLLTTPIFKIRMCQTEFCNSSHREENRSHPYKAERAHKYPFSVPLLYHRDSSLPETAWRPGRTTEKTGLKRIKGQTRASIHSKKSFHWRLNPPPNIFAVRKSIIDKLLKGIHNPL